MISFNNFINKFLDESQCMKCRIHIIFMNGDRVFISITYVLQNTFFVIIGFYCM